MSSRRDFIRNAGAMMAGPYVLKGLSQVNGASAAPVAAGQEIAPSQLVASSNRRYLLDSEKVPMLMQGDAAWSLIVSLGKAETGLYLRNRRQKGFNAILVNLIEHKFCKSPPRNAEGEAPFATPGDFSTPNERYFAYADWVLHEAAKNGIYVLLAPIYLG